MKKVIIAAGILLVFALSGYAWQNSSNQDKNDKISEKLVIPDFERPEEKPSLSGIVKTIIGNEVTILKIERSMKPENGNGNIEKTDKEKKEPKPASGFGKGMDMGKRINTGVGGDAEKLAMLKSMSVGEEKLIIPVGIKMLKSENGKMIVATLDDITKDQMLMIWIDETITDKNIATFVMIK